MTDPIDLDAYRPHEVSKVRCGNCGHKWTAVHPVGTTGFECPNCHEMEGQAMTDIVKGMVNVLMQSLTADGGEGADPEEAMRAALQWLADTLEKSEAYNDTMSLAARRKFDEVYRRNDDDEHTPFQEAMKLSISSAIRAAAGEEGK